MPFLINAFFLVFLVYLLALRYLPRYHVTYRSIFFSTLLIGCLYLLYPVVTSPDIFSYIGYARMGVIYHLNPLTTLPTAIANDPVYPQLYWNNQPSAYGPVWAGITSLLQWLTLVFGTQSLLPMVLALRLLGLATHLCSTLLIWHIVGRVQHLQGPLSAATERKRWLVTFAFAWNPLLLFEACVNAHNDAQVLLLLLLALWFLLPTQPNLRPTEGASDVGRQRQPSPLQLQLADTTTSWRERSPFFAILLFALATCLKLNVVVLLPFVLIYLWKQSRRPLLAVVTATLLFGGVMIVLYAPFWQHGALLNVLHTNPTTSRDINTLPEFLFRLYNSIITDLGFPRPPLDGSAAENVSHTLSIGLFVLLYALLLWQALRSLQALRTFPSLLRWLALVWLLYCTVGTPWFWPWYTVTFFGFYALVAATQQEDVSFPGIQSVFKNLIPTREIPTCRNLPGGYQGGFRISSKRLSLAVSLLAFSMLSIYCFYAWAPHDTYIPGLPDFQWAYLRGVWAWLIPLVPLLALWWNRKRNPRIGQRYHVGSEKPTEYK